MEGWSRPDSPKYILLAGPSHLLYINGLIPGRKNPSWRLAGSAANLEHFPTAQRQTEPFPSDVTGGD